MNKITFLILCIALLCGCSTNQNIDSAIKDIYGSKVSPKEEDGAYVYVLNYLEKENKQDTDFVKLKDKIDKYTNSLSENVGNDVASKSDANTSATSKDDCLSDFYKWNRQMQRGMKYPGFPNLGTTICLWPPHFLQ